MVEIASSTQDKSLHMANEQKYNSNQTQVTGKRMAGVYYMPFLTKIISFSMFFLLKCHSMDDVLMFANNLNTKARTAFLLVVSAVIWCIWKQQNDLCFKQFIVQSCCNIILTIISIVVYWTGQLKEDLQEDVNAWLPQDLDAVPLQVSPPDAERLGVGFLLTLHKSSVIVCPDLSMFCFCQRVDFTNLHCYDVFVL